jgi:hypothetical protein
MSTTSYRKPSVRKANLRNPVQEELESTVHYWWWRFLKKSTLYLTCCEKGGSGRLAALYKDFGDVRGDSFAEWCKQKLDSGDNRFSYLFYDRVDEAKREGVVTLNSTQDWEERFADEGYMLVAINTSLPSRSLLLKQFKDWMNRESRSPNFMTDDERKALIERRLYYWATTKDGKLVRKRRKDDDSKKPKISFPRKEKSRGKRGRPDLKNRGTARYTLEKAYATSALKRILETYDAVEHAKQRDIERQAQKKEAIQIWRELAKLKRYKEHKLKAGNASDKQRVISEINKLYSKAEQCLVHLTEDRDKRKLSTQEGIDTLLAQQAATSRNKEKTPYWKIGILLEQQWMERKKTSTSTVTDKDIIELTKTVSRLYQRAKKIISGTEKGAFPVG